MKINGVESGAESSHAGELGDDSILEGIMRLAKLRAQLKPRLTAQQVEALAGCLRRALLIRQ